MHILGIETSCDECAAAIVEDGRHILSNVIMTQIPLHERYQGVVPEVASRAHIEWIMGVVRRAISEAGIEICALEGIAATAMPGLIGSLAVGLSFAKALAWSMKLPFKGVNHMLAHLYAPQLIEPIDYPFIGLLVSGGHTVLCRVEDFDRIEVLGRTIDDAAGEAFDKVAKYYGFGYPGGAAIDKLAENGDEKAFKFPMPSLHKGEHRYDVSYSGLKTAVIYHLSSYLRPGAEITPENIAASFRKTAIDILISRLYRAIHDTGIHTVVVGGGVAANSYLRRKLKEEQDLHVYFPPLSLCGDNGAMVAGIAWHYFRRGEIDGWNLAPNSRFADFKWHKEGN